jgi:hypothetical protein
MNKGISRKFRENKALASDFIALDERTMFDMMVTTLELAQNIDYYNENNTKDGNWASLLLNDRLFIMAKIVATDIQGLKIKNDQLKYENGFANTIILPEFLENCAQLVKIINDWNELLNPTGQIEPLFSEIPNLINSIEESLSVLLKTDKENVTLDSEFIVKIKEFIIEENTDEKTNDTAKSTKKRMQTAFETFDDIYGKIIFFKETVSKKLKKENISPQNHAPHIGLLLAFYKLFEFVRQDVNSLTQRHLDFYYRDLLQQKQNDRILRHEAFIACTLNKGMKNSVVTKGSPFDFDMGNGQKMTFYSDMETEINRAVISDIKTIFKSEVEPFDSKYSVDAFKYDVLYETDILESLRVKGEIQAESYTDFPLLFDGERLKQCDMGFIISSPILMLEKGSQVVSIELKLDHDLLQEHDKTPFDVLLEEIFEQDHKISSHQDFHTHELNASEKENIKDRELHKFFREVFDIYITTEEGWKLIDYSKTSYKDQIITIKIPLESRSEQLVSFNPLIHDGDYDTDWPCIRFYLNNYATYHPYIFLKEWEIDYIRITADVSEVTNLNLSNSNGNLDHKIPFAPFGSTPEIGSFFRIQNPLILQRNLTSLELSINWSGLPMIEGGFEKYYEAYQMGIKNDSFKAFVSQTRNLARDASVLKHIEFDLFELDKEYLSSNKQIKVDLNDFELHNEIRQIRDSEDEHGESLYVMLKKPDIGFGHAVFPEVYAKVAIQNSRFLKKPSPLPKQPFVPVIDQLTVKYTNTAKENMLRKQDDKTTSIKLFLQHPFGHAKVFPGSVKSPCRIIPQINDKGSLFLGLKDVYPNDIVSIGFDLIAATLSHSVLEYPKISWSYLINNEWHDLANQVLEDTTIGLRKSGIVKIEVPQSIQIEHTLLPSDKFWIRACYGNKTENFTENINTRVKRIFMQAVPLSSEDPLPVNAQAKSFNNKSLKINAPGNKKIEKIIGPMNLVLNAKGEDDVAFYSRISERLRHKNRGIMNWDIERILLEKFQQIEKIRVYGRNSYPKELVQGSNIQIVVIPKNDLSDEGSFQSSEMDINTLEEIKNYAKQYTSHYAQIEVCNPVFEKLKIRCRVSFDNEQKSSLLRHRLNKELVQFLSPNLQDFDSDELFEKSFTKTEIFNFIAARPYVKEVSKFSVIQLVDVMNQHRIIDTEDGKDKNTRSKLQTISAYAILTSVDRHHIEIGSSSKDTIKGIGDIAIGSDFIIADKEGDYID